jgi:hypothetical protein
MAKIKNKQTTPASSTVPKKQEAAKTVVQETPQKKTAWWFAALIALVTILVYSNTFQHRFVLDDHGIIKNNKITKSAVSWDNTKIIFSTSLRKGDFSDLENSLYRPFTKFIFNIEWNLFHGSDNMVEAAHKFHVVNVLLYALLGVFLFYVLYDAFQKKWVVAFFTTMLFMLHPIHTEVVANIKSGDEILSLLGIVIALRCIQLYISKQQILFLLAGIAAYLMGSFSKESTVVAVAIFPLFIYFFTDSKMGKNALISGIMLGCSLFFLLCRHQVLHQYPAEGPISALDNYLVLCTDGSYPESSRFASAINTLGLYLQTFVFPHPLSCDYSYKSLLPVGWSHHGFLISFLLLLAMLGFAIWKLPKRNVLSFGLLWFFISMSITSNVFMLIGTSFGERLFFVPSLGLCLVVVYVLHHYLAKSGDDSFFKQFGKSPAFFAVMILVFGLFAYKTNTRNTDWKSDFKLFSRDVVYYPNSTHLLFYIGNHLSGDERKETLTKELTEQGYNGAQIKDSTMKENFGAINYLTKALSIYPALPGDGYNQLGKAYYNVGKLDSAQKYYMEAYKKDSTNGIYINNLGTVLYVTNHVLEAMPYFKLAHERDTTEADFMNNVGCIYGATQRPDSAIYWFDKASKADPMDITSLGFLEITYRAIGKIKEADYYKERLAAVKAERAALIN